MKEFKQIVKPYQEFNRLSKLMDKMNPIPEGIQSMIDIKKNFRLSIPTIEVLKFDLPNFEDFKLNMPKIDLIDSKLLKTLQISSKIAEAINNNPESQFAFISDLEILNLKSAEEFKESLTTDLDDEDINEKEKLLDKNLLPYLKELEIEDLWIGASRVLESDYNPDRLRHCLISLRTLLEYLIETKFAPNEELKDIVEFEKDFRGYKRGNQKLEDVKPSRKSRIEYFTSKFEYGILDEFTKNDIQYVCDCYKVLCSVHQLDIGITENQVRSLKVKTGITIWLLISLYQIIKN